MSNESELTVLVEEMLAEPGVQAEVLSTTLLGSIALSLAKILDILESKSGDFYDDSTAPQWQRK